MLSCDEHVIRFITTWSEVDRPFTAQKELVMGQNSIHVYFVYDTYFSEVLFNASASAQTASYASGASG